VAVPGAGVADVEVKGGSVWHDGEHWQQTRSNGSHRRVDPVGQARDSKYAVRRYVEQDPRWRESERSRLRWAHAVVLPGAAVDGGFALPDCPRWLVADRHQLDDLAACLTEALARQETHHRPADDEDVALVAEILRGGGLPQQDVVALAEERDVLSEQLTHEQAVILGAISLLPRVEIRGGAGSGKTWLALEPARRLSRDGQRVALPATRAAWPSTSAVRSAPGPAGSSRLTWGSSSVSAGSEGGAGLGRRLQLLGAPAARGDAPADR
jgi:hypothetical protein